MKYTRACCLHDLSIIQQSALAICIFQPTEPYDYIKKDNGNQTGQCTFTINTEYLASSQPE